MAIANNRSREQPALQTQLGSSNGRSIAIVSKIAGVAFVAVLGGMKDVYQFTGRNVMKSKTPTVIVVRQDLLMKLPHGFPE